MHSAPRRSDTSLTVYRVQYQTLQEELAHVNDDLYALRLRPWPLRLLQRGQIRLLEARAHRLQQQSDSVYRLMQRLVKQHNPNAFE
ncbi:hypothetical protein [Fibrella aquatilis]|uniref:Uncharacterized protein n=1 Tax=Fibrella aquatilis TaxID=2817059 RepID=A0A939JWT7_9BACT|nr:hypothetical protein [Fibrella aquatilis]MBO0930339.1 hypothetical protein [Fibrella aquatilis]